jgi:hypothetical protein
MILRQSFDGLLKESLRFDRTEIRLTKVEMRGFSDGLQKERCEDVQSFESYDLVF